MSYSNYYLNMRLSNLQYQVNQLTATSGSDLTLAQVHSSLLPFTVPQIFDQGFTSNSAGTFNNGLVSNNLSTFNQGFNVSGPSSFNDLVTGTITHANAAITAQSSLYADLALSSITAQSALFAISADSALSSITAQSALSAINATSSTSSVNAINSTNINISDIGASPGLFFPAFVSSNTGQAPVKVKSSNLTYNASSNTLTTANFNGLASSANALNSVNYDANPSTLPVMIGQSFSGSLVAPILQVNTSTLTYQPTPGVLTAPQIHINSISSGSTIQIYPVVNLAAVSTCPNASNTNQIMNYQTSDNLINTKLLGYAGLNLANTFTNNNVFNSCPSSLAAAVNPNDLVNLQTAQSLITGGITGVALLNADPQSFTGQNIFNVCPETPAVPTVNKSLVNLLYLNNTLATLRNSLTLKASSNIGPINSDFTYEIVLNNWGQYLENDFFTIRYNISNNYNFTNSITATTNTANSTGYVDIYPARMAYGSATFADVLNYNVINNTLNGSSAYDMNSTLSRGRWFWAYNQSNTNAPRNLFYLFQQAFTVSTLTIGLYLPNPSPGNQYTNSFNIELLSSLNQANLTSSGFITTNF